MIIIIKILFDICSDCISWSGLCCGPLFCSLCPSNTLACPLLLKEVEGLPLSGRQRPSGTKGHSSRDRKQLNPRQVSLLLAQVEALSLFYGPLCMKTCPCRLLQPYGQINPWNSSSSLKDNFLLSQIRTSFLSLMQGQSCSLHAYQIIW